MKEKKSRSERDEEPVFVELKTPKDLRKTILASAIECISTLKDYEISKSVREIKEKQRLEAEKIISSLKKGCKGLKSSLPSTGNKSGLSIADPLAPGQPREHKEEPKQMQKKEKKQEEKIPIGVMRLERELESIRNKLNSL